MLISGSPDCSKFQSVEPRQVIEHLPPRRCTDAVRIRQIEHRVPTERNLTPLALTQKPTAPQLVVKRPPAAAGDHWVTNPGRSRRCRCPARTRASRADTRPTCELKARLEERSPDRVDRFGVHRPNEVQVVDIFSPCEAATADADADHVLLEIEHRRARSGSLLLRRHSGKPPPLTNRIGQLGSSRSFSRGFSSNRSICDVALQTAADRSPSLRLRRQIKPAHSGSIRLRSRPASRASRDASNCSDSASGPVKECTPRLFL